jgi:hypothetical protein
MNLTGTTFGIGTPGTYVPWGLSPYNQGFGIQSLAQQPYLQPFANQASGGYGFTAPPHLQQVVQLLQIVPQQLQQVQALQQQQLIQLQQLLQILPAQLQQLQQLVQFVPQQVHQLQQWQPFGQATSGPFGYGAMPQPFGGTGSQII